MKWRKKLILTGLHMAGSNIPSNLRQIKKISQLSQGEIEEYQNIKLKKLLLHAYEHVPYYHQALLDSKVIENNHVNLEKFSNMPILTKEIIRANFGDLVSNDLNKRKWFKNSSGGSTGQPLIFLQDRYYMEWNFSNKIFYCYLAGKDIGQREMKIWGSERDLIEGSTSLISIFKNYLYNRLNVNSFDLTSEKINKIIADINNKRPNLIWGYVDSLFIISKYIIDNDRFIESPKGIFSTAGTLTEDLREIIKRAFCCPVYNVYGSREVGDMAFEDEEGKGLSIFQHSHILEVITEGSNEMGNILVTSLNNYLMPFIRYNIGDLAGEILDRPSIKNNFLKIDKIHGRVMSIFITKDGKLVPPEFFCTYHRCCV